tara:strand:- start:625 stop:876 length:252 start_codon:yes stop_codon:yes gene_type:complete
MNIGDNVEYENIYGENCNGPIVNIYSDMDSYDEMRLENGVPLYYSKKLSKFVPVKPKNMDSVFVEVFTGSNISNEFISFSSVV